VHAYKFEIERIDDNVKRCKDTYCAMMRQNGLGVVEEMPGQEEMD
jgi:hypothetical protein